MSAAWDGGGWAIGTEPWIVAAWKVDGRLHIWDHLTLKRKRNVSGTRFPEEQVPPCCHQRGCRMQNKIIIKKTGKTATMRVVAAESG